ncbi:MAG TPA: alpha/beta fold hydrolase, partial [Polyangiaceae bacterium]
AWLREMRVLELTKNLQRPHREGTTDELGVAGHLIDAATRQALNGIDLLKLQTQPAAHALVVARDDLPSVEVDLVRNLSDLGVDVELCVAHGYADSMPEDPFKAATPTRIFESIAAWLSRFHPADRALYPLANAGGSTNFGTRRTEARATLVTKEHFVELGGLFGIATQPLEPNEHSDTAILLLNVGANHHVGSNRMYVHFARAWAARGFRVIRLDFSGMGDSPPIPGGRENDVYAQRFLSEAQRGIDYAQALGASRFVLMGLCSGAYVAYHTAVADPRVTSIVMVNPLTFHWTEGDSLEIRLRNSFKSNEDYRRQLFQVETWKRIARGEVGVAAITRELGRRAQRRAAREARSAFAKLRGEIAEATDVHQGFLDLCARGTKCLLIFGAQDGGIDLIEEHLGQDALEMRGVDGFRMEVIEGPDHTFTPLWTQELLEELVTKHLLEL